MAGLVELVTFHNPENGFCVLRLKARGHRDLVTVVGHAAMISAGEWATASGDWTNDRTHGRQFRGRFLKTSAPLSIEGIEKYLGSGMIRGIGSVYAKRMVQIFGRDVFDVIEASPEQLREIGGIGPMRAARITSAWADQKVIREIMVFLHAHAVGTARAVRIFDLRRRRRAGDEREPLPACARHPRHGAPHGGRHPREARDREDRDGPHPGRNLLCARGGHGDGHCGLPTAELARLAETLLEAPRALIDMALNLELAEGVVIADSVGDTLCVFLSGLYHAEKGVADRL